jgi:hypothetical protein
MILLHRSSDPSEAIIIGFLTLQGVNSLQIIIIIIIIIGGGGGSSSSSICEEGH